MGEVFDPEVGGKIGDKMSTGTDELQDEAKVVSIKVNTWNPVGEIANKIVRDFKEELAKNEGK